MKKSINHIHIVSLLLIIVLTSLCMFGCKGKDDKKNKEKDTVVSEKQEKKEDTNALPKEKQMAKDIDSFGANAIAMSSGTYTLKTSSIEITKAKEDAEQYVVYCTATQESNMFNANNSYKMTYNFYDVGGWVLDECIVEKIDMIPKTTIPEEEARYYATGGHNFTSLTHTNTEKVSDTQYIFHYVGKYEYNYMDDVYNNDVVCTYDNEFGWYISYVPQGSYHDWSKMYGTWYGEGTSGKYKYTVKLKIKDVNDNTGKIKFDVDITNDAGFSVSRSVKEAHHRDVVMDIDYNIGIYAFYPPEGAEYLLDEDFHYYQEDVQTIYDKVETWYENMGLIWGKDIGMKHCYLGDEKNPILTKITE